MVNQDRESYKYLQVDRPVLAGADRFLPAVADIGRRVLSGVAVTAPGELHLEDDELVTTHRPIDQPRLDVYSPHDLKMVLLRRVASSVMGARFNFNHQAAELTTRRKAGQSRGHVKGVRRPGSSSEDILNDIGARGGERVTAGLTPGYDPILGRFLALVPNNLILAEQAEEAFDQLGALSPRIAHGSNAAVPHVPFASLPADISAQEYTRLTDEIAGLPTPTLTLGRVDIYASSSVPRQNPLLLADD